MGGVRCSNKCLAAKSILHAMYSAQHDASNDRMTCNVQPLINETAGIYGEKSYIGEYEYALPHSYCIEGMREARLNLKLYRSSLLF